MNKVGMVTVVFFALCIVSSNVSSANPNTVVEQPPIDEQLLANPHFEVFVVSVVEINDEKRTL